MKKTGLMWFGNDLRLQDNPALTAAASQVESLLCVYIIDPKFYFPNRYGLASMGRHRWQFLQASLADLNAQLQALGHRLHVIYESPMNAVAKLITAYQVDAIFRTRSVGYYENTYWTLLKQRYRGIEFNEYAGATLFSQGQLPFELPFLPKTFSQFKILVEPITVDQPDAAVSKLPAQAHARESVSFAANDEISDMFGQPEQHPFCIGGETAALNHVKQYFASPLPSSYKQTRNALDGWGKSTKFSPWLAMGSVSVKTLVKALRHYEQTNCKNDSTYWIYFELLWREYFQWYAVRHDKALFAFAGISGKKPLTSFYAERFKMWCEGNTPFPLVNACMNQLNSTGYMSNRGRQIVASCLTHEMGLDWRFGAAYFEQQLIDYDVASNWGNWQYVAGVGADPRGHRRFNLQKQADSYDPFGEFVKRWQGHAGDSEMDSVDAADWPNG